MPDMTLILIAVALAAFIFFQFRSSRKRQRETEERQSQIVPGVEIMTNFGLYGTVVSIDEDENIALVEVAPGTVMKMHRQVIMKAVEEPVAAEPVIDEDGVDAGPQLNTSNAIPLGDPEFGERVDPDSD